MSTTVLTHVAAKLTKTVAKAFVVDPISTLTVATVVAVPTAVAYGLYKLFKK